MCEIPAAARSCSAGRAMIAPIMKDVIMPRPELGTREGLAYALFLPQEEPVAGVVILHGDGSAHAGSGGCLRAGGPLGLRTIDVPSWAPVCAGRIGGAENVVAGPLAGT